MNIPLIKILIMRMISMIALLIKRVIIICILLIIILIIKYYVYMDFDMVKGVQK